MAGDSEGLWLIMEGFVADDENGEGRWLMKDRLGGWGWIGRLVWDDDSACYYTNIIVSE